MGRQTGKHYSKQDGDTANQYGHIDNHTKKTDIEVHTTGGQTETERQTIQTDTDRETNRQTYIPTKIQQTAREVAKPYTHKHSNRNTDTQGCTHIHSKQGDRDTHTYRPTYRYTDR